MFDLNDAQSDFDPFSDFPATPGLLAMSSSPTPMEEVMTTEESASILLSSTDKFASLSSPWKGKGVSRPMDIPSALQTDLHDVFDVAEASTSHSDREYFPLASPSSFSTSHSPDDPILGSSWRAQDAIPSGSLPNPRDVFDMGQPAATHIFSSFSSHFSSPGLEEFHEQSSTSMELDDDPTQPSGSKGKGKEKELPPTLPPLNFTSTQLSYEQPESSGDTGSLPVDSSTSLLPIDPIPVPPAPIANTPTTVARPLFRRRSLPSLAAGNSTVKSTKTSRTRSTLARKLLFRKYDGDACPTPPSSPTEGLSVDLGAGNCFAPWRNDSVLRLEYDEVILNRRHQSFPFPVSPLDLIPGVATDAFTPIPFEVVNYFDDVLPRELRVQVLLSLIAIHEMDLARAIRDDQWTAVKASSSRNKWVGRDKALRDLVRFSRVSKSWRSLVFDGQIWRNFDLHAFPILPSSLLLQIAQSAGSFIRQVNLAGHVSLSSGTLIEVTDNLSSLSVRSGSLPFTFITGLNLLGCSSITTRSLHHLLIQSRSLERLCLKGLSAVTNTTCEIIGIYCPKLTTLDLGRCMNIDASGIRNLAATFVLRGEYMAVKELRLSGLKHVDDSSMATLGRAAPFLEVLDLSYSRGLHNTAIEALVACRDEDKEDLAHGIKIVTLNAREVGRTTDEATHFRRRVTRLRHLILSSCILLTDVVCSHLAFAVPKLEFLELAGIGSSIEDDGLIRLLNTTPLLRRLDLEDASSITDAVLTALTPPLDEEEEGEGDVVLSPLEHLVVSGAMELTDDAFLSLIRGCKRLRVLEADNTHMGPIVMKTFVRTIRQRELSNAKLVAVDCRGFGEPLLRELSPATRPRLGWVSYGAKELGYLDARDGQTEDIKAGHGQDELDEKRVVVKTFYGWQTVNAVQASREKRRKSRTRRTAHESFDGDEEEVGPSRVVGTRWWSPGGRRSPAAAENGEGCVIM